MDRYRSSFGRAWPRVGLVLVLAAAGLLAGAQSQPHMPTLVRLAELIPGTMVTEETCTIVYLDGKYHSERISHKTGEAPTADVYEGSLGTADFNKLMRMLESPEFRGLKSPVRQSHSLVVEDYHLVQITVPRAGGMQDLNYPTRDSRKRDGKVLKPVLGWWKDLRTNLPPALKDGVSNRCKPASVSSNK